MKYTEVQQMRKQAAGSDILDNLRGVLWAQARSIRNGTKSRPDYSFGTNLERNVFSGPLYSANTELFGGPGAYRGYKLPALDEIILSAKRKHGQEAAEYVAQNLLGDIKGKLDAMPVAGGVLAGPDKLPKHVTKDAVSSLIEKFKGQKAARQSEGVKSLLSDLGNTGGQTFEESMNALRNNMRRSLGVGATNAGRAAGRAAGSAARTAARSTAGAARSAANTAAGTAARLGRLPAGKSVAGVLGTLGLLGAGYGGYKMMSKTDNKQG